MFPDALSGRDGHFLRLGGFQNAVLLPRSVLDCEYFVDILFVRDFHMGVPGVAWATFLCQSISGIVAVISY